MLPKLLASALLGIALIAPHQTSAKRQENKQMKQETSLFWTQEKPSLDGKRVVDFSYSPATGLSDIDFHQISARDWPAMRSPTPDAVARVEIPATATTAQIAGVIDTLKDAGKYRFVELILQH